MRGEFLGEVKGDATFDKLDLRKLGEGLKPGPIDFGKDEEGVGTRATCQGAGADFLMTVMRCAGLLVECGSVFARNRQRMSRTAFSRSLPDNCA